MDALCRRTAVELAGLIRVGDVSSREVVEAHLARIDEVNDYVNAVTLILRESALEAADAADRADAAERARPFHGVPFTIKENIDFLGTPTTDGLPSRADAMPRQDAPIVERMKRAGAVPLARTNLPEMGSRLDTDNPLRGRTRNPWNGALTPGGSSGGEGAALATGMNAVRPGERHRRLAPQSRLLLRDRVPQAVPGSHPLRAVDRPRGHGAVGRAAD